MTDERETAVDVFMMVFSDARWTPDEHASVREGAISLWAAGRAELKAALRVSEITHRSTVTFLRDLHNDHIEWKRIPRRIRDLLDQWAITVGHIADRDRTKAGGSE